MLLHYHGGSVYALPTADPHVWRVAGIEVCVGFVADRTDPGDVIWLETLAGLAESAERRRRGAAEATQAAAKRTGKAKR